MFLIIAACFMSSVPKSKRNVSSMEFFHNAMDLRKYLTFRLLKDFGIKSHIRTQNVKVDTVNLSEHDKTILDDLLARCNSVRAEDIYPEWFINLERKHMVELMQQLIGHITHANVIYANTEELLALRRSHQTEAIAVCHELLQELGYLVEVLPDVEASKLVTFVTMCTKEIALLKGWRKSSKLIMSEAKADDRIGANAVSVANSTNFCNANDNGNANNNHASNVNGVRPISGLNQF